MILIGLLSMCVDAASEGSQSAMKAMERVFARSDKAHAASMAAITGSMTERKAWNVLEKHNLTTSALIEMTHHSQGKRSNLRQPTGYAGIDGARKMLNDMIYKAMQKYDEEIAKCTEYYSVQCAAMEACRGQISQANYCAANSRKLILDAQTTINLCEKSIPQLRQDRTDHNTQCANELKKMKARLSVIEADIEVMTTILQMTDCKTSSFAQMKKVALLRCQDPCTKKTFVTFDHDRLKQKVSQLQSSSARKLMADSFADLFQGISALQSAELMQVASHTDPIVNLTTFNNPPVPRTEIPVDPCTDKDAGAPSADDKRNAKCTISKSPQCYALQERFLLIQSGIQDERDALLEDIASMDKHCKEVRAILTAKIENDEHLKEESETKLAFATEKEATAGEEARQTAAQNDQLDGDLKTQMKTCSTNYINFETEICALKKIRGELYKMQGSGHSSFFQDCEVSKWEPEECSTECKAATAETDGEQKLTRNVMTHPDGGASCLPLEAVKKCNLQPCPVDCKLEAWSGWSKCSAECGGGVQQRLREVTRASAFGGKPCGSVSETRQCNIKACESDCVLSEWSKWSWCSKDCDGGTRKRSKHIVKGVEGEGTCPDAWDPKRLQYKDCNMIQCPLLKCDEELDVIFLLDGSGSLGESGWKAEIKAAETFVDAFSGTGAKAEMSVILFSGPRTWSGVYKCWAKNSDGVDMENDCKIKTVTHFTSDMAAVKSSIAGLTWPEGSTLTSLALMRAKAELSLGRKDAKSVVVVITDGRPLSYGRTTRAAKSLRKAARLVWVPVTSYAPLGKIKKWATRRWEENVVLAETFEALENPAVVNHVIANICPTHGHLHSSLWSYTSR